MSLGARQAGVEIIGAVERCAHAARTYSLNFPGVPMIPDDIRSVKELPAKPKEAVSVLFGGPPCQGFSTSNQRTRTTLNPNNWLFGEFIRLTDQWQPDVVIIENVRGILETAGGVFHAQILEAVGKLGYETKSFLLNAADFGVPQRRSRVFIVGSRLGEPASPLACSRPAPSVWDAIHDLPTLENGASLDEAPYRSEARSEYAQGLRSAGSTVSGNLVSRNAASVVERFTHVPAGGNWQDIPAEMMGTYANRDRCHTGIYRRLRVEEPSVVIGNYRKNMLIHPTEHRGLSVREAARLQSIPDGFRFSGSIGFQQQQVGNMVPPRLSLGVFSSLVWSDGYVQ